MWGDIFIDACSFTSSLDHLLNACRRILSTIHAIDQVIFRPIILYVLSYLLDGGISTLVGLGAVHPAPPFPPLLLPPAPSAAHALFGAAPFAETLSLNWFR